jgi:hypothetical protein
MVAPLKAAELMKVSDVAAAAATGTLAPKPTH